MDVKTVAFYNYAYPYGGGETVSHHLGSFFRSRGMRVLLYSSHVNQSVCTEEDRRVFEFRQLPEGGYRIGTTANIDFLTRSLGEERVDVLIVQGLSFFPFEAMRQRTSAKLILCVHNRPMWEVAAKQQMRINQLSNPTLLRKLEFLLIRKPSYRFTDRLLRRYTREYAALVRHLDKLLMLCPAYCEQMQQQIQQSSYPGHETPDDRFGAILNPLLPAPADTVSTPKEKIVLYVGRLSATEKRVDRLLRIWQRIEQTDPDWRLILVGSGAEEEALKRLAAKLHLQRVEFAGFHSDVTPFYRRATFCCLTSNFEGLPMAFMEGQQYGVIPVAFNSFAGLEEIAHGGKSGIVVPAFDSRHYAAALSRAMRDSALQQQLRTACYEAATRYELGTIGQQWLDLFRTL